MTPRHQVSRAAIELIKRFEGYRRKAAQLPDGRWTIGYGHTLSAREGAQVSEQDAEALLLYDLIGVAHTVNELAYAELTQNQFDALCAFAFSIGLDAFRACAVLKRVNEGAFTQAAFALELWRKAEFEGERIVVDAMVRRRAAEKLLFLTPPDGVWRPVPSALLKPELDAEAIDTAPRGTPAEITAPLDGEQARAVRVDAGPEALQPLSPVTAAAEAVSARLQTLFADEVVGSTPEPEAQPEAEAPSPELGEDPAAEAEAVSVAEAPDLEPEPELDPMPRILREPVRAPEPAPTSEPKASEPQRIIIDDTAPFEFVPAPVQPLMSEPADGGLAVVALAILGLAFFAGGVFWALNARPATPPGVFTPLLVGWLAGVAGVGFIAAAVFMLLQRMARAADGRSKRKRKR